MTVGCARCGDCCDPVILSPGVWQYANNWNSARLAGLPDPGTAEGWAYWTGQGYTGDRQQAVDRFHAGHLSADFITEHWTVTGENDDGWLTLACDRFDPTTRQCMAHDERPPICSGFPWYGRDPGGEIAAGRVLGDRCSYWADVPASGRPEGARPLLPLTVVQHDRA